MYFVVALFWIQKDLGRTIACKLVLFGLAVYLVVPVSVRVADLIDATYGASMENTIASAKQATDEIKGEADTQSQGAAVPMTVGKVVSGRDWWTKLRIP